MENKKISSTPYKHHQALIIHFNRLIVCSGLSIRGLIEIGMKNGPLQNYSTRVQQRIAQCLAEGEGAVGTMARAINSKYEEKMYGKVGTNNEHFTVD